MKKLPSARRHDVGDLDNLRRGLGKVDHPVVTNLCDAVLLADVSLERQHRICPPFTPRA
jgi:hypothetical protein